MDSNYQKFNIDDYTKSLKSSYANPAFAGDSGNLGSSTRNSSKPYNLSSYSTQRAAAG